MQTVNHGRVGSEAEAVLLMLERVVVEAADMMKCRRRRLMPRQLRGHLSRVTFGDGKLEREAEERRSSGGRLMPPGARLPSFAARQRDPRQVGRPLQAVLLHCQIAV